MKIWALLILLCTTMMAFTAFSEDQPLPRADIIFIHGNIYSGAAGSSSFGVSQRAEALAVRGDRISMVGSDVDVLKTKGPRTQIINLGGRFVMPGFNDAHLHLSAGGFEKLRVNLVGVKSLSDFRDRIQARVATAKSGEWILGGGWDQTLWPVKELPSRWDIDEVSGDHPVFLTRVDGHIGVANTLALKLARITVASKAPDGGKIDRDSNGQPTGVLRETAKAAVNDVIPTPTHDDRRSAIETALRELAESGVTSAQDNSKWEDFQVYEELEREGKLTARITEWLAFDDPLDTLEQHRSAHAQSDKMLHTGMLKGFVDGSLGSRTAALVEPYSDDPSNSGLPQYETAKLNQMTQERIEAGFQIGFHAIGDKGVQMALDAFAEAEKDARGKKIKGADGGEDFRLRVEHAQVTTPAQVAKFKQLKVIASMQPSHVLTDMSWAEARLGTKRAAHSYAWAEMLGKGVPLAFGTDYPVEPVRPFRGLYAAITRKSENGKTEYYPEQKLTVEQAIAAYTRGSAFAEFAEKDKGTLAPGMLADFVVLDQDVTSVPPLKMLNTRVLRTVVGGKTVYEAK